MLANLAVALRLFGLSSKLPQLRRKLLDHIIDAQQILFRIFELQFRLMTALIEARDPGRLFEHPTARFGFGVDQLGNLTLPDQRRRMRSGRSIGKEHLHVFGPHILRVGLIRRANVTGDPAHNVELVGVIEPRRRQSFGVVDLQAYFGKVARRPGRGAGKDHVFHATAPHRLGTGFPHHPTQRLQEVRLATAIRPHDTCQPIGDEQVSGVHKAFEAVEPEFGKAQVRPFW